MNHDQIQERARELQADVTAQRIAAVYAEALLDAAGPEQAEGVVGELRSLVHEVFAANPEAEEFFASRAVSREHKEAAADRAFRGAASETFLNFLHVLNRHDRLDLLRPILAEAQELFNRRAGRVRVQVRTARPLGEDQQERLKREVREALRLEPFLEVKEDPELLGGVVVRIVNWVFDGSVRTRLDNLRKEIIERSSHEIQRRRDRFSSDAGD
jgi:F-type H+-transporting ATPase subunit delta